MRKFFLLPITLVAVSVACIANAADLPNVKAPPVFAPPAFTWTGFYVGLNAGGAFASTAVDSTPLPTVAAFGSPIFSQRFSSDGFIGGGQLGYNYQTGPLVVGLETDFQGSTLRQSSTLSLPVVLFVPPGSDSVSAEHLDWFGTVRGRVGYAMDRVLFYATGGLIYGQLSSSTLTTYSPLPPFTYSGSDSDVRVGFIVGGGVEYAIDPHWSVKAEGFYYEFTGQDYIASPLAANPPFAISDSARLTGAIGRVGVNYKFDLFSPPTPVVAKY